MAARPIYGTAGIFGAVLVLLVRDVIVRRRPHPVTWIGAVLLVTGLGVAVYFGASGTGYRLLHPT